MMIYTIKTKNKLWKVFWKKSLTKSAPIKILVIYIVIYNKDKVGYTLKEKNLKKRKNISKMIIKITKNKTKMNKIMISIIKMTMTIEQLIF